MRAANVTVENMSVIAWGNRWAFLGFSYVERVVAVNSGLLGLSIGIVMNFNLFSKDKNDVQTTKASNV